LLSVTKARQMNFGVSNMTISGMCDMPF